MSRGKSRIKRDGKSEYRILLWEDWEALVEHGTSLKEGKKRGSTFHLIFPCDDLEGIFCFVDNNPRKADEVRVFTLPDCKMMRKSIFFSGK